MKIKKYRRVDEIITRIVTKAQKKLHLLPSPLLFVNIDTLDNDGNITERISFKSNSFVRNAYNVVAWQCGASYGYGAANYGDGYVSMKGSTGTRRDLTSNNGGSYGVISRFDVNANYNSFAVGGAVQVGSSNIAETLDDYMLGTAIVNGVAAGQLSYGGFAQNGPLWDSVGRYLYSTYGRTFTNNSGADVIIREIGLFNKINYGAANTDNFLWARDVLPAPITLAHTESRTITYTIKFPY